MAYASTARDFVYTSNPMPALPEKMAGEWLPRPAAYRPAGTNWPREEAAVNLWLPVGQSHMNKKIGKENERQNAESA